MRKIVIAGGTGFIDEFLASRFRAISDEVIIISRYTGDVRWSDEDGVVNALNNAE